MEKLQKERELKKQNSGAENGRPKGIRKGALHEQATVPGLHVLPPGKSSDPQNDTVSKLR